MVSLLQSPKSAADTRTSKALNSLLASRTVLKNEMLSCLNACITAQIYIGGLCGSVTGPPNFKDGPPTRVSTYYIGLVTVCCAVLCVME